MNTETDQVEVNETATETEETHEEVKAKSFTQEQLDKIVEDRLLKQRRQFERKYSGVDLAKYNELVEAEENKQLEAQKARGEFESILKSTVEKKDSELNSLRSELHNVKVNGAVINAASKFRAINPEQVTTLLSNQVRLGDHGEAEVVDNKTGQVRYNDKGEPLGISELVEDFLKANPHFVSSTPGGSDSQSNLSKNEQGDFDLSKLDMRKPEHRKQYAEYRKKAGIAG